MKPGLRAFGGWVLTSLLVAYFHEPWRAEAQSWLIARTSDSLGELFFRSATEGAGPLFYLWIWPWAKLMPAAFPSALFWLSWTGSALAVGWLLLSNLLPFRFALLAAFGYLLGYEYASFARLYGWGIFFLLAGIDLDRRGKAKPAGMLLAASCLVHVTFCFAVIGWAIFRGLHGKFHRHFAWVGGALALLTLYLWPALGVSPAKDWVKLPGWIDRLGTSLSMLAVPSQWRLGIFGIPAFGLALAVVSARARLALILSSIPFVLLFLWRVDGAASARHGGALFVLWLALLGLTADWRKLWIRRSVYGLLGASLFLGVVAQFEDLFRPYSEGMAAARAISSVAVQEAREPRLFAIDENAGYVTAAKLGSPLWSVDAPMGCPYFPGKCPEPARHEKDVWSRLDVYQFCPKQVACFFVGQADSGEPFALTKGRWEKIYLPTGSLSEENVVVYRLSQAP